MTPVESGRDPQNPTVRSDLLLEHLMADDPILLARDHRALRNTILRATEAGRLRRLLPGVYVDASRSADLEVRATAINRWDRDAVICGRAAAALSYWPEIKPGGLIELASPNRHAPQRGFKFAQRAIPPELILERGEMRLTVPSLTAMELATYEFTDPIDIALRTRVATLDSLRSAIDLTPHRRGHTDRRRVLLDSRDAPWSAAERLAHRIYRQAGIVGWVTNLETFVPDTGTFYIDIAFRRERLASEIDGRLHETDVDVFETDRTRQNALVLDGWMVLRFTWHLLQHEPRYVIHTTEQALAQRRTERGLNAR